MSTAIDHLKLPAPIKDAAARLAERSGISLDEWIAWAVEDKVGALETAEEFFRRRAGGARAEDLEAFLAQAPDHPPEPGDELPDVADTQLREVLGSK